MWLVNKVVVLTLHTSGIGYDLTRKFLVAGNGVIARGRHQSAMQELQQELRSCTPVRGDLTTSACLADIKKAVVAPGGELDVLFNVAGVQFSYDFMLDKATTDKLNEEFGINSTAPLQLKCLTECSRRNGVKVALNLPPFRPTRPRSFSYKSY